jgi:hypothetical protein
MELCWQTSKINRSSLRRNWLFFSNQLCAQADTHPHLPLAHRFLVFSKRSRILTLATVSGLVNRDQLTKLSPFRVQEMCSSIIQIQATSTSRDFQIQISNRAALVMVLNSMTIIIIN